MWAAGWSALLNFLIGCSTFTMMIWGSVNLHRHHRLVASVITDSRTVSVSNRSTVNCVSLTAGILVTNANSCTSGKKKKNTRKQQAKRQYFLPQTHWRIWALQTGSNGWGVMKHWHWAKRKLQGYTKLERPVPDGALGPPHCLFV